MNGSWGFKTACLIILMLLPASGQAQFSYSTNGGLVTITGYTGTNGIVTIPSTIAGLPVTAIANFAFYQRTVLTNVTLPDSIITIGVSAFFNCIRMTNIALGANIRIIGSSAFQGCSGLVNVVVPNSVTNMGSSAFAGCGNLQSVTLGSNLVTVSGSAFAQCSALTNLTIPYGVKNIGGSAFSQCWTLPSITLPDTVTNIGVGAFSSCSNLIGVALGTNLTVIEASAFRYCSRLPGVALPESVKVVGDYAFSLCTNLASITIGTNTTSIGNYTFQQCLSLTQITIPAGVTNIGNFTFANCFKLTEIAVAPDNPAYVSVAGALLNRSQTALIQYPVGNAAQTYTIPNTVTNIREGAFQDCTTLASVVLPAGVSRIPNNTFRNCASLTSISIPDRATDVGNSAFLGCSSLTNATIGHGVTNIQASAFSGCTNLARVSLGYILCTIGNEAFRDCSNLSAVFFYSDFPNNVSTNAFTNAPATVYYLPGAALWSTNLAGLPTAMWTPFTYAPSPYATSNEVMITACTDPLVAAVTIPNTIASQRVIGIGEGAFNDCTKLISITIPASITNLGSQAFASCTNLIDIYFEGNAPTADLPVFAAAPKATIYYRPEATGWSSSFDGLPTAIWIKFKHYVQNGVVGISGYADTVKDVIVPYTINGLPVTRIEVQAFRFAAITSIAFPDSVTVFGNMIFDACVQLTSVKLPKNLYALSWFMFASTPNLTNITIPASVQYIADYAFYADYAFGISGLRTVYFEGNAPSFSDAKTIFPGAVTAYYLPGTTGWSNFLFQANIQGQLWDPQIQSSGSSFGLQNNQFGFNITGTSNLAVVVEAATNTLNPIWTRLQTNTLTDAPLYFSDSQWTNYGSRFYRLRWP